MNLSDEKEKLAKYDNLREKYENVMIKKEKRQKG